MKDFQERGFNFRHTENRNAGGKAGKGHNLTVSIHVTCLTDVVTASRYFSYTGETKSYNSALSKARIWIERAWIKAGICPHCNNKNCISDHK